MEELIEVTKSDIYKALKKWYPVFTDKEQVAQSTEYLFNILKEISSK